LSFDIHDQAGPAGPLAVMHAAHRRSGTYSMLDQHASSQLEDNLAAPTAPPRTR
jgi:hypothetical protein